MHLEVMERKRRRSFVRAVCGLCGALCLGFVGCGSSSSSAGPGQDNTADFGIVLDSVSANTVLKPGQTTPVTLDLVSFNGFPHPITLNTSSAGLTAFVTPTLPSLPKGTTKVILNVTIPAGTLPANPGFVAYISATGGGQTRYLNGSVFNNKSGAGALGFPIAGLGVVTNPATYLSPFTTPPAFTVSNLTGSLPLVGVNITGPVTVTVATPSPGITATLGKSVFTPTSQGGIQDNIPVSVHIDASVGGGSYPLTFTMTEADGTKVTSTINLFVLSMTFATPTTLTVTDNPSGAATGSVEADLTLNGLPIPPGVVINVTLSATDSAVQYRTGRSRRQPCSSSPRLLSHNTLRSRHRWRATLLLRPIPSISRAMRQTSEPITPPSPSRCSSRFRHPGQQNDQTSGRLFCRSF